MRKQRKKACAATNCFREKGKSSGTVTKGLGMGKKVGKIMQLEAAWRGEEIAMLRNYNSVLAGGQLGCGKLRREKVVLQMALWQRREGYIEQLQ